MNTPSIKVALADNNRPHVETTADYKESLFLQQYTLCFNQVNSILYAKYKALADKDDRSLSQYINIALKQHIGESEKKEPVMRVP